MAKLVITVHGPRTEDGPVTPEEAAKIREVLDKIEKGETVTFHRELDKPEPAQE
jgi:hypothetical protein